LRNDPVLPIAIATATGAALIVAHVPLPNIIVALIAISPVYAWFKYRKAGMWGSLLLVLFIAILAALLLYLRVI
jgi:hypothetical protein